MSRSTKSCASRLILHFDVNKTLIMSDSAGGKSMSDIVKQSLMQSVHGTMVQHPSKLNTQVDEEYLMLRNWLEHRAESTDSPGGVPPSAFAEQDFCHDPNSSSYMSLDTYVQEYLFPYKKHHEPHITKDAILKERQLQKKKRKEVIAKFTLEYYKHHRDAYTQLLQALRYQDNSHVFILPAFFKTILWLEENQRDYSIVFRTFGDIHDIEAVTKEFNSFCTGNHPQFPHNHTRLNEKRIDITNKDSFGFFHRNDDRMVLVLGEYNQPKHIDATFDASTLHRVIKGEKNIYQFILDATNNGRTLAIRDFYSYWSYKGELPTAGKVFLVDTAETDVLQIFFDDNISIPGPQGRGIVDLRDAKTHKHLSPQKDYEGLYLKHVNPVDSIPNHNYFIECIQEAEKRLEDKRQLKTSML